jgi:hypothetical protein
MVPFPEELRPPNEISGNIFCPPEFLITVGVSEVVDLFVNQLCHSHLQTRFPTETSGEEEGAGMKFATVTKSLALGLALLLALNAFAATKGSLQLSDPVKINGTTLKPGDYKVEWEGSGSNVEVSIKQGKNILAKASAHQVELDAPAYTNAVVTLKNGDGTSSLTGLRFQGKKFGLELGESSDGMPAESSK